WHQGKKTEAAEWFDRAVASANKSNSPDYLQRELRQFHAEAAALMGLTGPKPEPTNEQREKNEVTRQTAKNEINRSSVTGHSSPASNPRSKTSHRDKTRSRPSGGAVES